MNVGGLFDGAGLLALGLHRAGLRHTWLCESDPWRRELLAKRFPGVPIYDDVRGVGGRTAIRPDIIAGGFPCKGASTAGKRNGFEHPETVLWREMFRAVRELRPRYVLIENVANLLSMARSPGEPAGSAWAEVLADLASLGFYVEWDCFPAAAFGAPHLRDRLIAVARHPDGEGWPAGRQSERAGVERPRDIADEGSADAAHAAQERWPAAAGVDGERGVGQADRGDGARPAPDANGAQADTHAEASRSRGATGERAMGLEAAADAEPGRHPALVAASERNGREAPSEAERHAASVAVEWGDYQPAIARWEAIQGPAPEPLICRLDDGDRNVRRLRSRVDRSRLSALGDGVQVQLGELAGRYILELERQRCLSCG